MDDWRQVIYDSLTRIEQKLDAKVDHNFCLERSRKTSIKYWVAFFIAILAVIGGKYV